MTPIERYQLPTAVPVPRAVTEQLARVRTRLNPFTPAEQGALINWGYAVCDTAMRKHVMPGASAPTAWPDLQYPLDQGLPVGVEVEEHTDPLDTVHGP